MTIVPFLHLGQREISVPVSSSIRSWGGFLGNFGQSGIESQQFTALGESAILGSVGKKAEVTDAHEAIGKDMEQEAADEFLRVQGHGLFSVSVSSVPVAESDLAVLD